MSVRDTTPFPGHHVLVTKEHPIFQFVPLFFGHWLQHGFEVKDFKEVSRDLFWRARMSVMEFLDQSCSIFDICCRFPVIMWGIIAFSLDQILQALPIEAGVYNFLTSYPSWPSTSIGGGSGCFLPGMVHSKDTWNTGWSSTLLGNLRLQSNSPTRCNTLKGPNCLWLSFRLGCLMFLASSQTLSPIWNTGASCTCLS